MSIMGPIMEVAVRAKMQAKKGGASPAEKVGNTVSAGGKASGGFPEGATRLLRSVVDQAAW
jgi:hypothetical protein